MLTKKVNRYWCEFCKKAGCSAGHMKRHEERCTRNPNRVCGMCKMLKNDEQPELTTLIALFPMAPEPFYGDVYIRAVETAMPLVREQARGCPACILAARKLAGVPIGIGVFDFKAECASLWKDINNEKTKIMNLRRDSIT